MMKPTYLPLVNGIQDADADSADTQTGKLADAVNVHVHPERLSVLSMRPRFVGKTAIDANARLCVAGGRPAFIGEDDFGRLQDDGAYFTDSSDALMFRPYSVVGTEQFVSRQKDPIRTVGYAEQTNGDRMVLVAFDDGAGNFQVYYQRVANGRKYAEQAWTTTGTGTARVFVFPRTGGAGFLSIVNSAVGGAVIMRQIGRAHV